MWCPWSSLTCRKSLRIHHRTPTMHPRALLYSQFFLMPQCQIINPCNHHMSMGDRLRMRAYVKGNVGSSSKVASLVNRIESKLRQPSADRTPNPIGNASAQRPKGAIRSTRAVDVPSRAEHNPIPMSERCNAASASSDATETMFATHDAWGFWGH